MIIEALIGGLLALVRLLLSPLHFPSLDNTVLGDLVALTGYISVNAYNLVYFLLPKGSVQTLLVILLAVIAMKHVYHFVMWVLRKIPMFNIG